MASKAKGWPWQHVNTKDLQVMEEMLDDKMRINDSNVYAAKMLKRVTYAERMFHDLSTSRKTSFRLDPDALKLCDFIHQKVQEINTYAYRLHMDIVNRQGELYGLAPIYGLMDIMLVYAQQMRYVYGVVTTYIEEVPSGDSRRLFSTYLDALFSMLMNIRLDLSNVTV